MLAGPGDGEALVVEQLLDAQHIFHVTLTIHSLSGAALDRLELRELGLPEAQHVSRETAKAGYFTDAEIELVRDDRIGGGAGLAALFLLSSHRCASNSRRPCRDSEFNSKPTQPAAADWTTIMPPFGLAPGGARRKLWPASACTRLNGGASRSLTDIKTNCIISQVLPHPLAPWANTNFAFSGWASRVSVPPSCSTNPGAEQLRRAPPNLKCWHVTDSRDSTGTSQTMFRTQRVVACRGSVVEFGRRHSAEEIPVPAPR